MREESGIIIFNRLETPTVKEKTSNKHIKMRLPSLEKQLTERWCHGLVCKRAGCATFLYWSPHKRMLSSEHCVKLSTLSPLPPKIEKTTCN